MWARPFCLALVMLAGGTAPGAIGQTNAVPDYARLFIAPEPHLRAAPAEPQTSTAEVSPIHPETPPAASFVLSRVRHGGDFQPYHHFIHIIEPVRESDDPVTRGFDAVFRPEQFHLGKTATVSCTLLTAIKRRNPLCLLNPIFLNVSW